MNSNRDTIIRISPEKAEIVVEQSDGAGVTTRKSLTPETFAKCIIGSRFDDVVRFSGVLPENCIGTAIGDSMTWYFIRYPKLYADISYYGTVYEAFPIPRLVFSFAYDRESGKVLRPRLCVVKDERLTPHTPTYKYPFSNVFGDHGICLGNNALPAYKDPTRIFTLADFILRMPNNNDMFHAENTKLDLGYRDLLEHLKDKPPAYYYTDVLIPDGKTLKDFFDGR
ncbi:MAG: hypothetical protein IJV64_04660 [Oscillospiraceae bacterium]|nr:hypothetical protein [Oscillospiraceae bacterium]